VKNLKMRVESMSSRLDFDERRARALEGVVQYRPGAVPPLQPPGAAGGAERPLTEAEQAERRSRRRRRRGRRRPGDRPEGAEPDRSAREQEAGGRAAAGSDEGESTPAESSDGRAAVAARGAEGPRADVPRDAERAGEGRRDPGESGTHSES